MSNNRGQMTIGAGLMWTIIVTLFGCGGGVLSFQLSQNDKINNVASALNAELSATNQRVTATETNINTLVDQSKTQGQDIKELLRIAKYQ